MLFRCFTAVGPEGASGNVFIRWGKSPQSMLNAEMSTVSDSRQQHLMMSQGECTGQDTVD
jgi:hypothetical protein